MRSRLLTSIEANRDFILSFLRGLYPKIDDRIELIKRRELCRLIVPSIVLPTGHVAEVSASVYKRHLPRINQFYAYNLHVPYYRLTVIAANVGFPVTLLTTSRKHVNLTNDTNVDLHIVEVGYHSKVNGRSLHCYYYLNPLNCSYLKAIKAADVRRTKSGVSSSFNLSLLPPIPLSCIGGRSRECYRELATSLALGTSIFDYNKQSNIISITTIAMLIVLRMKVQKHYGVSYQAILAPNTDWLLGKNREPWKILPRKNNGIEITLPKNSPSNEVSHSHTTRVPLHSHDLKNVRGCHVAFMLGQLRLEIRYNAKDEKTRYIFEPFYVECINTNDYNSLSREEMLLLLKSIVLTYYLQRCANSLSLLRESARIVSSIIKRLENKLRVGSRGLSISMYLSMQSAPDTIRDVLSKCTEQIPNCSINLGSVEEQAHELLDLIQKKTGISFTGPSNAIEATLAERLGSKADEIILRVLVNNIGRMEGKGNKLVLKYPRTITVIESLKMLIDDAYTVEQDHSKSGFSTLHAVGVVSQVLSSLHTHHALLERANVLLQAL